MTIMRKHIITQPDLSFRDLGTGIEKTEIWDDLKAGLWKVFSHENWMYNDRLLPEDIMLQKPLFPNLQQVVPGMRWDEVAGKATCERYSPRLVEPGTDNFLALSEDYFRSLNASRIGVHLSGGLDSSLIIAVLRQLNIPFVPVGIKTDTYEFRTERKIQEILLGWGDDGELIELDETPYYSALENLPPTQIPHGIFKSYAVGSRLADVFRAKGCDVVLGGQGGDSLFVDAVDSLAALSFNIGDEFEVSDERDLVYTPRGLRLYSFYAHKPVIDFISSARLGQKDDPLKWWARRYFKDWLPRELTEYAYFADFFGQTMWGLEHAKPIIAKLMSEAHQLTGNPAYSPGSISKFLSQDVFSFEYGDYINFCSNVAVAVWYKSLKNGGIIQ